MDASMETACRGWLAGKIVSDLSKQTSATKNGATGSKELRQLVNEVRAELSRPAPEPPPPKKKDTEKDKVR